MSFKLKTNFKEMLTGVVKLMGHSNAPNCIANATVYSGIVHY
jgi:hypothetical protein